MLNKPLHQFDNFLVFGNNQSHPIVGGYELTKKERKEFDYMTDSELDDASFFRYKKNVYFLGDFMRIDKNMNTKVYTSKLFDGIVHDTYFSGILVKYTDDNETVLVYTYYVK